MNDKELRALEALEAKVAQHLAGRSVIVRWQQPESVTAMGQAYKMNGQAVIDVFPAGDEDTRLGLWLHELAHIRHDWDMLPSPQLVHKAIPVVRSPEERHAWRVSDREARAKRQTAEWEAYAEKHALDYWRSDRRLIEMKLWALLDWAP